MKCIYPLVFSAMAIFAAMGCHKKHVCGEHFTRDGNRIGLRGFDPAEVDSIRIVRYKPDSSITFKVYPYKQLGDVSYINDSPYYSRIFVGPGGEYDITVLPAGSVYHIADFEGYETDHSYETDQACGLGGGYLTTTAKTVSVDGEKVRTIAGPDSYSTIAWIALKKK